MAKVDGMPGPLVGPTFKKPVPMNPPLTAFDPAYLKRKAELPEQIFRLKNGKQFSYFSEGNSEDKVVVFFPGAGIGKWMFVPREPIPGVFLVVIDNMGHGNSSPLEKIPVFSEDVEEIKELLDELKIDKFYVAGHSCGGIHASQVAVGMADRVLGCAMIGSPCDVCHPSLSKAEAKKLDKESGRSINSQGCFGGCIRSMMSGVYYFPDKTKDFGFAGHSYGGYGYYKGKATGGAPLEMDSDHFFISKMLDGELHGTNTKNGLLLEMQGIFSPWSFDVADIKCPTFIYNEGQGEVHPDMARRNYELIPNSQLCIFKMHGHCSIVMECEKIIVGLVEGKLIESSYENSNPFSVDKAMPNCIIMKKEQQ